MISQICRAADISSYIVTHDTIVRSTGTHLYTILPIPAENVSVARIGLPNDIAGTNHAYAGISVTEFTGAGHIGTNEVPVDKIVVGLYTNTHAPISANEISLTKRPPS